MDEISSKLDWSLIRAVLSVAETGSLSAAARATGQSQPTLGRQIRSAEAALGTALFSRHTRGLTPTEACTALLPAARTMAEAARQMDLIVAGHDSAETGPVRITASRFVSVHILPPILADIRAEHPGLSLDLVASDSTQNLLFHEADIAIRMYRPTQLDMITRHLGEITLGLFAHHAYFDRHGRPQTLADLERHAMIGYDRDDRIIKGLRDGGIEVDRDWFSYRTDDQIAYWALVEAAAGIGFGQMEVGRANPSLEQIFPEIPIPPLPVWLTAHPTLRQTPRVARVWDALADRLQPYLS